MKNFLRRCITQLKSKFVPYSIVVGKFVAAIVIEQVVEKIIVWLMNNRYKKIPQTKSPASTEDFFFLKITLKPKGI